MNNYLKLLSIFTISFVFFLTSCSITQNAVKEIDYNDSIHNNDSILAVVENHFIELDDVLRTQKFFSFHGQDVSKDEILEHLINEEVLFIKSKQEGITVTDFDVESSLENQLYLQGTTLENLKQDIELQGLSYSEELKDLKRQMAIQIYLENNINESALIVSESDAKEFYDYYELWNYENSPSFDDLKEDIVEELTNHKWQSEIYSLIQSARDDINIEYR